MPTKKKAAKTVKKAVKKAAKPKVAKKASVKKKAVKKAAKSKRAAKKSTKKAAKSKAAKKASVKKKAVKKAAKSKAAKKASVKKKAVKKAAKSKKAPAKRAEPQTKVSLNIYDTQDVPADQHFFFVNGHHVKNVKELAEIMDHIEQEIFDYHVNEEKNDFFNWVKHVFEDIELAEKLVGVTGPKHLQFTIYKHVADKALKKKKC